ncbi:hypothetical protein DRN94_002915 [archaeon]|nr:hypothetical protein [archaeon]
MERVSWSRFTTLLQACARDVLVSDYRPNVVVGVLGEGVLAASIIAKLLAVEELAVLAVRHRSHMPPYEVVQEPPRVEGLMPDGQYVAQRRILLVDALVRSGKTLRTAADWLYERGAIEVRTLAPIVLEEADYEPDYYAMCIPGPVLMPWDLLY